MKSTLKIKFTHTKSFCSHLKHLCTRHNARQVYRISSMILFYICSQHRAEIPDTGLTTRSSTFYFRDTQPLAAPSNILSIYFFSSLALLLAFSFFLFYHPNRILNPFTSVNEFNVSLMKISLRFLLILLISSRFMTAACNIKRIMKMDWYVKDKHP